MNDRPILEPRGNRHDRRKMAKLTRIYKTGSKSQADVTRAYAAFKRSADERADSIKFAEFAQQRPDLNISYEPRRWVAWYNRQVARLASTLRTIAADPAVSDIVLEQPADMPLERQGLYDSDEMYETTVALVDDEAAFPQIVTLEDVLAMHAVQSDEAELAHQKPAKKTRKPRTKKIDTAIVAEGESALDLLVQAAADEDGGIGFTNL